MSKCRHCNIEITDDTQVCPLCRCVVEVDEHTDNRYPDIRFRTKDDYAVIAMVRQGLGVSIMPSLLLRGNNEGVELRPLDPPAYRTIALTMGSVETGPAARQFAEFAKAWVKENA